MHLSVITVCFQSLVYWRRREGRYVGVATTRKPAYWRQRDIKGRYVGVDTTRKSVFNLSYAFYQRSTYLFWYSIFLIMYGFLSDKVLVNNDPQAVHHFECIFFLKFICCFQM